MRRDSERSERWERRELEGSVASVAPLKEAEITAEVLGRLTTLETIGTGKVRTLNMTDRPAR